MEHPVRALLSVYDKTGIVNFAERLNALGWELVSSGGTKAALAEAGLPVLGVDEVTGSPEMLDGRVKTLHPAIHGGILADRSKAEHMARLVELGIAPIDMVVGNLYPFRSDPSVELIDIGGPTMVRAAAKNHDSVAIVVNPADYEAVASELESTGAVSFATRRRLARDAFAHTAAYDAAIVRWFDEGDPLPPTLHFALVRAQDLRYGENPHQHGARYRDIEQSSWWDAAVQHGGKALSYLNVFDTEAAWRLAHSIGDEPAVAIIKHANPCGVAVADDIATAYQRANACDPDSAFGGIVAANRIVTVAMAEALAPVFTEVVIAPGYEPAARELLLAKKNMRVMEGPPPGDVPWHLRSVDGGLLVQDSDRLVAPRAEWSVVTEAQPTDEQWADLELAWQVGALVSSNCIVLVKDRQAVGIGAGQQSRKDAAAIAAIKANGRAGGGAAASDAFFPFRDGLDSVAEAGVACVIQPGGSIRDAEVIAAANEQGLVMVFTGERHFRH
jgi:phosphoribosylaminoimidazolecarboxamide formyltransferase / IMP cyclohydrolase